MGLLVLLIRVTSWHLTGQTEEYHENTELVLGLPLEIVPNYTTHHLNRSLTLQRYQFLVGF
jgi:hypothetical protein